MADDIVRRQPGNNRLASKDLYKYQQTSDTAPAIGNELYFGQTQVAAAPQRRRRASQVISS